MAIEYAKVIKAMKLPLIVIGRGKKSALIFEKETNVPVITGGLDVWLKKNPILPKQAIIAVNIQQLATAAKLLLNANLKKILVEKPAGLNSLEIKSVNKKATDKRAKVFVAYNRRFYASVIKAQEIAQKDGGILSFNFEFTEWSHVIKKLNQPAVVKKNWLLANSSHVIDLAFYLGGLPLKISSYTAGHLDWHPSGAIFAGSGVSESGALFSYHANWQSPGRWGLELLTKQNKIVLKPLEKLFVQPLGSNELKPVKLTDSLDQKFKPGLYREVLDFNKNGKGLLNIKDHAKNLQFYKKINNHV